jgi:hypothetical protein
MNLERHKINSPYTVDADLMSEIAKKIQKQAGIEVCEIFEIQKPLVQNLKKSIKPIQLSVEFGSSYVAERPEDTYIAEEILKPDTSECTAFTPEFSEEIPVALQETVPTPLPLEMESTGRVETQNDIVQDRNVLDAEREAEMAFKRAQAAARYAALIEESKSPEIAISGIEPQPKSMSFPWTTVLGFVISFMAIASAWWVWQFIQKPLSVEQIATQTAQQQTAMVAPNQNTNETTNLESLSISDEDLNLIESIEEMRLWNTAMFTVPNFVDMDEQSKISMVQLEANAVHVLTLESHIFESFSL